MTWYVLGRLKARIFGFLGCVLSFSDGQACKAWFSLLPRGSLFFRPKKERPWERGRAEVACVGHSMAAWNIYWKGRRFTERRKTRKFRFPFCWGEKRKTNWFNNQLVKERESSRCWAIGPKSHFMMYLRTFSFTDMDLRILLVSCLVALVCGKSIGKESF